MDGVGNQSASCVREALWRAKPPDDPDAHSCGYGPYSLMVHTGTHEIEAVTGSGEALIESFDLTVESQGNIIYRHPSADSELDEPILSWQLYEQAYMCA